VTRVVLAIAATSGAWIELAVDQGVTLADANVGADVERLNARAYALEDVRPSVEGVSHFL
jgi:hypothetical protein